jgi:PAS domain S-box-containing protein
MLAAKIGIWQWDTRAGTVLWDDRNFELFGLDRPKLEGAEQPFYDLTVDRVITCVHPEDRQYLKEQIAKVIEERSDYYCEYRVVWPDLTVHDIEARGEIFFDDSGEAQQMTGVSMDVTERKRALRSLEESEQRLKLVVEAAEMGIWDVDLESGVVWQSLKHAQLFGYDQLQPGWSFADFLGHVVPEDRQHVLESHDRTILGDSFSSEFRIVNARDNAIHWMSAQGEAHKDSRGKTIRMLGVVADISARKEEEQRKLEAIRHREQLAHSIVQHAPVGILTLDASLNVTDCNNTFAEMIHRDGTALLAANLSDILPPKTFRLAHTALNKAQPLQLFRQKVTVGGGHLELVRYWDMAFWPIVSASGVMEGAVLQIIDCTDTVNLEEQRDDFVAAIAHDIKNPLIGAERLFDLLCNQTQAIAPTEQAHMLSLLKDNNKNLLNLVQNLVDVYRCESMTYPVHYETLDLKCLVASCLEQVADFAQSRQIRLVNDMSESPPPVQADEVGIRRVLMNLLHNAIKFDKEGGTTSISIEQADGTLQIQVADTGDGIDEEDQKKLFKRFSQGKAGSRYSTGTGLGLHVCKQIIMAHHGTISCKSTVGRGSTFSMSLPLLAPDKAGHLSAVQIDTAIGN